MPYLLTVVTTKADLQAALNATPDGAFVALATIGGNAILVTHSKYPTEALPLPPASVTLPAEPPSTVNGSVL